MTPKYTQMVHRMQLPREVIVGKNIIRQVGEICSNLGFSGNVLAVTDSQVHKLISKKLENSLEKKKISVEYVMIKESTLEYVHLVEDKIKEIAPAVVLGVGGGKSIDVAKLSSANMGDPFISIPTAASHDGIASAQASMKDSKQPFSIMGQAPIAIIADIGLISKAPYRLTASGASDIIAKYTAVRDWDLARRAVREYYGDYAANLALMSAKLVMKSANGIRAGREDSIRTLVEALISCSVAMSIAGSSRPCSGSEHIFSHALDLTVTNQALHGEKCAVGTIICAYLQRGDWKMIRSFLKRIGAPITSQELGVDAKDVLNALVLAPNIRPERYTILNAKKLDRRSAEKAAKDTHVID